MPQGFLNDPGMPGFPQQTGTGSRVLVSGYPPQQFTPVVVVFVA